MQIKYVTDAKGWDCYGNQECLAKQARRIQVILTKYKRYCLNMQSQTDNVALFLFCILARNLQRRLSQGTFLKN